MIRNIIFDMGGVLIRFDREYFIDRLGITDEADKKLLMREVFQSLEWAQMDRGALTDYEATDRMCLRLPEHLHDAAKKLTQMWDRPILPIPGMEAYIRELKARGYKLYLLSNASCRHPDYWPKVPGSELFDGRLISYEVHYVKPEQQIYRILCDRYQLKPEECVFIDDNIPNAEGAVWFGMEAIVFHGDAEEFRPKLETLLQK